MNFAEIANKKMDEIERPPLAPVGMYRFQVTKVPTVEDISNGAYTQVSFPVKAVEAYESVDEDDLKKFGGFKNVISSVRFLFDNNDATKAAQTQFRLKNFIEMHLAVEGAEKMTLLEAMNASVNAQCDGELGWRPDKNDPEVKYAEIKKTSPIRA